MVVPVDGSVGHELVNGVQEASDVADGLEPQEVGGAQGFADTPGDVVRDHVPVLGRGPGYVDEVLDHGLGHALSYELGQQIQVVVVADDDGRLL